MINVLRQAMKIRLKGGSVYATKREHLAKKRVTIDEDSYDEEEVGNDEEVTDVVVIGGGSEEEWEGEDELERSGTGSDEMLGYMVEIY